MEKLTKEQQEAIEKTWTDLYADQVNYNGHIVGPGTKTYRKEQRTYFLGAVQTLIALGIQPPPVWEICLMTNRDPITTE